MCLRAQCLGSLFACRSHCACSSTISHQYVCAVTRKFMKESMKESTFYFHLVAHAMSCGVLSFAVVHYPQLILILQHQQYCPQVNLPLFPLHPRLLLKVPLLSSVPRRPSLLVKEERAPRSLLAKETAAVMLAMSERRWCAARTRR